MWVLITHNYSTRLPYYTPCRMLLYTKWGLDILFAVCYKQDMGYSKTIFFKKQMELERRELIEKIVRERMLEDIKRYKVEFYIPDETDEVPLEIQLKYL